MNINVNSLIVVLVITVLITGTIIGTKITRVHANTLDHNQKQIEMYEEITK